jgi:hypothetical protein
MKKFLFLIVATICFVTTSFAHNINLLSCPAHAGGDITIKATNFQCDGSQLNMAIFWTVKGVKKNGQWVEGPDNGTIINYYSTIIPGSQVTSQATFNFSFPLQNSTGDTIFFQEWSRTYNTHTQKYSNWSLTWYNYDSSTNKMTDYNSGDGVVLNNGCTVTPLTFGGSGAPSLTQTSSTTTTITWSTYLEINNSYFVVQARTASDTTWNDVGTVTDPNGNSALTQTFSLQLNGNQPDPAVSNMIIGGFVVLGLFIFMSIGKTKSGKIGIMSIILVLAFIGQSCKKSNVIKLTHYTEFRIKQVDVNGNYTYSKVGNL